jgi:hypothetical protein
LGEESPDQRAEGGDNGWDGPRRKERRKGKERKREKEEG